MKQLIELVEAEKAPCIGITGHRTNRLSSADCAHLHQRLGRIFAAVNAAVCGPVTLWSGMAEGADTVAAAARPEDWSLHMILTDDPANWSQRLRQAHPASARIFEAECASPDARISLVGTYSALGASLIEECDLLVAVWDGKPGSTGGTGEVVAMARSRPMPVLHIPFPFHCAERLI